MVVLKSFATPMLWVLMLLVLGLVLTRPRRRRDPRPHPSVRLGRLLLRAGVVLLLALSLKPVANLLTYPLESRYRPPSADVLNGLDVVVVLGGGSYPSGGLRQAADLAPHSYPRFYHGVRIFKENQAGLLAFCGGPSREGAEDEANLMKALAVRLEVPPEKILVETESRTTFENIANLARLLPVGQGRRIGLVTSALHLWRSSRVLAAQFPHDTIVPIPVCYTYDPVGWDQQSFVPSAGNFDRSTMALHEWIGLLWYSLRYRLS
jgi:uncharacterized SAM-binding protein YcdF (DUF218 family)